MKEIRKIRESWKSKPTIEGAGVRLKRVFGYQEVPLLDPFLLLDDFRSKNPDDYIAGFPWHPHRGIETITYMLHGEVEHGDSLGNQGLIRSGEVQWMTAGNGIIHQEMPRRAKGELSGFQLWANLPTSHKMMAPRYRDVKKEQIPEITIDNGVTARIICGEIQGTKGPVKDIVTEPEYLDVRFTSKAEFKHEIKQGHTAFAYVIEGEGYFDQSKSEKIGAETLVLFEDGDGVQISAVGNLRFLLISGKPIREPVAWRGPIVMNTEEELRIAFQEYQNGTFIKSDLDTKKGNYKSK
jgi:redox-sensitive bicupin YhaK (pirin superfamily)